MASAARKRMVTIFLSTGCLLACAGSLPIRGSVSTDRGLGMRDVVTAAELKRAGEGRTLLAALQQARPGFLVIDGGPVTELGTLRLIPSGDVQEIRLIRATAGDSRSALLPNGDVIVGDVLLVLTRKR